MLAIYNNDMAARQWLKQELTVDADKSRVPRMCIAAALPEILMHAGSAGTLAEYPWKGDMNALSWGADREIKDVLPTLAGWIYKFVERDPANICLIDEPLAGPSDPGWLAWVRGALEEYVLYCEGSIFYRVSNSNADEECVLQLLRGTYDFTSCCALVTDESSKLMQYEAGAEVLLAQLERLGRTVKGIAASAYDQEGLAIWTAKKELPNMLKNPW